MRTPGRQIRDGLYLEKRDGVPCLRWVSPRGNGTRLIELSPDQVGTLADAAAQLYEDLRGGR